MLAPPDAAAPAASDLVDASATAARLHAAFEREPDRHGFFEAVRRLQRAAPDRPRIGCSARPADDPVRFGQRPSLAFAPGTVAAFERHGDERPPRMSVQALGLFGPNGPLPGHLTEHAHERQHNMGDDALVRFADVFHHRMLSFFFRAWAASQPAVDHDRPDDSDYARRIGALAGIGNRALRDRDALPDAARLHYAGHFGAQARHAEALQSMIAGLFGLPCEIEEFVGEWIALPDDAQCRLGAPTGSCLGVDAMAGARAYGAQHKIRVRLGPMALEDYLDFLPGQPALARLQALMRGYVGDELAWELQLVLRHDDVPAASLGRPCALGWSCWLGQRALPQPADDLRLDPSTFHPEN